VGQRVMGHGSNGSTNVNGSRGSRVSIVKHLTHDVNVKSQIIKELFTMFSFKSNGLLGTAAVMLDYNNIEVMCLQLIALRVDCQLTTQ